MNEDCNRFCEFVGHLNQVKHAVITCCVGSVAMIAMSDAGYADCTIAEVDDPSVFGSLGYTLDAVGDANGDGHDDFVATRFVGIGGVYSGNDGALLLPVPSFTAAGAGDVNHDGFDDIILASVYFDGIRSREFIPSVGLGN